MATATVPALRPHEAPAGHHGSGWASIALRIGIFLVVAAAIAIGALRYRKAHTVSPVHYEIAKVDRGSIAARVTATGTVSALVTVSVGSQVSGRIESLHADFGSVVKKGQVVAHIEPSLFKASVEQARANLYAARAAVTKAQATKTQAEKNWARAKSLRAEGLMSGVDYETAEATVGVANAEVTSAQAGAAQAQAALAQSELNLRYTTILSPIDGIVISRNVDVGQTVAAALQAPTLFTIAQDLTVMQVDTNVAEADVGKIKAGMKVTFTVDAYPSRKFEGTVRQVRDNATTIQNVVTYDAVIDVANTDRALKPGMTANATFVHETRADAVRLPNGALRFHPDASTLAAMTGSRTPVADGLKPDERIVWVRRSGAAVWVRIKIGISDGTHTELVSGDIREGDEAIVEASMTPS